MDIFQNKNTDECLSLFIQKFDRLMDEMAPIKRLTNREIGLKQRPWINREILDLIKDRDKFHKNFLHETDINNKKIIFSVFKKKRNDILERIRLSKNQHYA